MTGAEWFVDEFIEKLRDLMRAVAVDSDTYGTYHEERELRKFLLDSGVFGSKE